MRDKIKVQSTYDRDRASYVYTGLLEIFSQVSITEEELRQSNDPRAIEDYVKSHLTAGIYSHMHRDTISALHRVLDTTALDYKSRSIIIAEIRRLSGLTLPEEDI